MEFALDVLSFACLAAGGLLGVAGGVGMLRFPDVFTRMHAASLADTGCAGFIVLGLLLQASHWVVAVKLVLILGFLFFTSPTATHALAKAAVHGGIKPWTRDREDGSSIP